MLPLPAWQPLVGAKVLVSLGRAKSLVDVETGSVRLESVKERAAVRDLAAQRASR